jgi:hypothetical protein
MLGSYLRVNNYLKSDPINKTGMEPEVLDYFTTNLNKAIKEYANNGKTVFNLLLPDKSSNSSGIFTPQNGEIVNKILIQSATSLAAGGNVTK